MDNKQIQFRTKIINDDIVFLPLSDAVKALGYKRVKFRDKYSSLIENIKGVYELKNPQILINKKVLLIDDIYTTGSTVNECCKMLQKVKTKEICVLVIAKD